MLLAVGWAASSQDTSRPAAATRPAPQLRLDLSTRSTKVAPGDWLKFSAVLVNEGREPVTVVLPGDGSTVGWRTPVVRWNPATPAGGRRCGNINVLEPEEVVRSIPGRASRSRTGSGSPCWSTPAGTRPSSSSRTYRISSGAEFRSVSTMSARWSACARASPSRSRATSSSSKCGSIIPSSPGPRCPRRTSRSSAGSTCRPSSS